MLSTVHMPQDLESNNLSFICGHTSMWWKAHLKESESHATQHTRAHKSLTTYKE